LAKFKHGIPLDFKIGGKWRRTQKPCPKRQPRSFIGQREKEERAENEGGTRPPWGTYRKPRGKGGERGGDRSPGNVEEAAKKKGGRSAI